MILPKVTKLIEKLIEKTNSGIVKWNKASGPDQYQLILQDSSITVSKWFDELNRPTIELIIYNGSGDVVESVVVDPKGLPSEYSLMDSFHSTVRRKYLKTDEILNNLMDELDSGRIVGKDNEEEDLPL